MTRPSSLADLATIFDSQPISGMRNRIINGAMDIAQRATTATGAYTSVFTYASVDRWAAFSGNASTTQAQSTDVPAGFRNSFRLQRPSSSTGFNALWLAQVIESVNCYDLSSQAVTLSFWAKRGANYSGGDLAVQFVTGTVADQGIANIFTWTGRQVPINSATPITTTWTRYVFTGTLGAGVLEAAILLNWIPTGTAGADDSVYITGVQLEAGPFATPFERRQFGQELALCQRYFVGATTYWFTAGFDGSYTSINSGGVGWSYRMRATPTVSITAGGMAGHHATAPSVRDGPNLGGVALQFSGSALRTNANCPAYVELSLTAEL